MTLNPGKAVPGIHDYDGIVRLLAYLVTSMGGSVAIGQDEYARVFMGPAPRFESFITHDPPTFVLKVVDNDDQQRNV